MRALVQRVSRASVRIASETSAVSEIGPGLLVLLGVSREDGPEQAERLAAKVRALRVFPDAEGNMNEALGDREILCVSQFTLYGDARRGNRPSFTAAAPGETGPSRCMSCSAGSRAPSGRVRRPHGGGARERRARDAAARGLARGRAAQRSAHACSGARPSSSRSPSELSAVAPARPLDDARRTQLGEALVQDARGHAVAALLQRAELQRTVAQLPQHAQRPAAPEQVEQRHDRPPAVRATNRGARLRNALRHRF